MFQLSASAMLKLGTPTALLVGFEYCRLSTLPLRLVLLSLILSGSELGVTFIDTTSGRELRHTPMRGYAEQCYCRRGNSATKDVAHVQDDWP